ncbi:uncharacterized protein N7469_007640 [Penicillium citrinum]|uniref:Uncharacterized protein n=1 Tax=Penicillium citrinum TaxID=5077 RepID=A0A9W9NZK3_PENCI|nr:uncharacterized protein N7469_007640 [Penicillium citrinum]KAJ5227634.1 hypothetical protein N7469_007640 [Penicillium citrinum]
MDSSSGTGRAYRASRSDRFNRSSPEEFESTYGECWPVAKGCENDAKQNEVHPGSLASINQEMRDLESYMSDETHAQTLPTTDEEWAILQEQLGQWSSS